VCEMKRGLESKEEDERKEVMQLVSSGAYIPPFKLARLMKGAAGEDRSSEQFQRLSWEALRKSLNGLVNRLNASNVSAVAVELFRENLVRGRGLFTKALMNAAVAHEVGCVCVFFVEIYFFSSSLLLACLQL
jgi:pre-mRNA-splicing factor CWC22